ncbi:MAG: MFS transporter [Actinomycetota bacterium]|nr:MFS transporter [Actinomycetota bacterium]
MTDAPGEADSTAGASLSELVRRPSVRNLLISRACGSSGAVSLAIANGVFVYGITGRELDLGWIGLAEFAPTFLLVLWAGALADRLDRRRMAAIAYLAEAAIALGIAFYAASGRTALWPIFVLTLAYGSARGFVNPATRALPANVVTREELPRLIPVLSMVWQSSSVAAPLLASAVYDFGAEWAFVAIALLDLIAAFTISRVSVLPVTEEQPPVQRGLRAAFDGLRLVRRTPLLLAAIGLDLFAVLLGGVIALAPPIVEELLHTGDNKAFWLKSAGGLGAALTAFVLARRPIERHVGPRLLQAVAGFGVLTICVAFSRSLALTLFLFAALAATDMISVFVRATIVPLATPDSLRGRVLAVEAVFIGASNELGAFESGLTAEWFGLQPAIVVSGIATIVVVALFAMLVPDLRHLDRFEDVTSAPRD